MGGCPGCVGAQLQEQVATLKEEYSRLGDAMEKTQGSAMQARPTTWTLNCTSSNPPTIHFHVSFST
jgi:hypothetical protein